MTNEDVRSRGLFSRIGAWLNAWALAMDFSEHDVAASRLTAIEGRLLKVEEALEGRRGADAPGSEL
ncbi:hypothetical protein [Sphingomonas astaxanthinifaciens]|uniref:Uncharacterized protein n=1 Tax=Sphingomonas astaxanthinifaciens DSM 22298 TaxID=1123267 RepID=A0ABQ5ZB59_9SPHN|nr:hypothetical protein [Sphingomonas astaxanthinifaciens]GLR48093.1 hypothetical protein GCM10007925_18060 [Sphingomonas astaxanthinifaciens DSM 22298]